MVYKLGVVLIVLLVSISTIKAQHITATSINLNSRSQFGGDYLTDNGNYQNVLSIGGIGAESGLKIYKQDPGQSASFVGSLNYYDAYVFEMTDANSTTPDGAIVFGGTGSDDVYEKIMVIRGNGNVGIGTIYPQAKFEVKSAIKASEIKVEAQTADFVFEEDYQLKPLVEVEAFVKFNKHLPEIPSVKQMEAEGVNVAEMNKLLLQKVEELTLYLIELKKENENQNSNNEKLLKIILDLENNAGNNDD